MKQLIVLAWLVWMFQPCPILAQSTFIVHFDSVQQGWDGYAYGVEETSNGLLVTGLQVSPDSLFNYHTFIRTIDNTGTFLGEREYWPGLNMDLFQLQHDPICALSDSTFISHLIWRDPVEPLIQKVQLIRFDAQGDTTETKTLIQTLPNDSLELTINQTRQLSDQGFAMVGEMTQGAEYSQGWVLRLNTTGDTIWTTSIGPSSNATVAYSVASYPDVAVIVAGTSSAWTLDANFVLRMDSSGNVLWRQQFGMEALGKSAVRVGQDGHIYTWSLYCDFGWWPNFFSVRDLRKWTPNGDLVWSKRTSAQSVTETTDLEILSDGSFICTAYTNWAASLMKMDVNGDSLWERKYSVFNGQGSGTTFPNDVLATSDGGFALCGWSEQGLGDPTPGLQTMFVIKTDSLGCVVPGCQYVGLEENVIGLENALLAYPNPSSGLVTLELTLPATVSLSADLTLQVFDAQGRLVERRNLSRQLEQTVALDLNTQPTGLYSAHLSDGKRILTGVRLVVE